MTKKQTEKYKLFGRYDFSLGEFNRIKNEESYPYFYKKGNKGCNEFLCKAVVSEKNPDIRYFAIIGSYIKVIKKYIDIDYSDSKVEFEYFNGMNIENLVFERSVFSRSGLDTLLSYGVSFKPLDSKTFLNYLIQSEGNAETEYSHRKLGWHNINNETVFKSGTLITKSNSKIKSTYLGNLKLNSHGSRDEWFDMVNNEVIGNIPLTMILLLGFASPILGYLNETYDLGSVLFNLSNSSSKGKTTAAMLAASVFGNPSIDKSTLITFNATGNALVNFASQCNSHTIVLDEAIISTASDVTKQLYTLCSGKDKLRLNSDSELKESLKFSSFIISTAEFNLISDTATNGIKTRAFELNNIFTTSAENSNRIKTTVSKNYGFAGREFMKFIFDKKLDDIERDYNSRKNYLLDKSIDFKNRKDELTERILSKLSIISLTALYFKECFNIDIEIDLIDYYLLQIEKKASSVSSRRDVLIDYIKEFISINPFNISEGDILVRSTTVNVEQLENKTKITVSKSSFDEFISKKEFADFISVLKEFKINGMLECEKDRLYKRLKPSNLNVQLNYYIFIIENF